MALDAGSVYATLGGRFNPRAFMAFDRAMLGSANVMSNAERRMVASQLRVSNSSDRLGRAARFGAGAGVLALTYTIGKSISVAADFEQQLSALQSVTGANARQLALLRRQAMEAGAATKYSALQAAQAQTELAKGGLSLQQILGGGLRAALALAAAGELELADAATYTVNAVKLFKLHGEQATHVADAFATAANETTADVQDFGAALVQGGGAARSAGYDFDQTVAILEAMAEAGVKNSDAGTSMKTALLQLLGPTRQQAETAKDAGIAFLDQAGNMKSIVDISAMLRAKTDDMTKAQRTNLFQTLAGTDGFRTLLALYDAGPEKLRHLEQGLERQGTATEVAARKQDNLRGRLENLHGSIETAQIAIGSQMLPLLKEWATEGTEAISAWVDSGGAERFGRGAVTVLEDLVDVGGDAVHILGEVGGALQLDDLDTLMSLGAALLTFKTASTVLPIAAAGMREVAFATSLLGTAIRSGEVAALPGLLAAGVNPVTALATGLAVAAGAYVYFTSKEQSAVEAAKATSDALREQAASVDALQEAVLAAADATFAARRADEQLAEAKRRMADAAVRYGRDSKQYRDAVDAEREVNVRAVAAHKHLLDEKRKINEENRRTLQQAPGLIDKARDELAAKIKEAAFGGLSKDEFASRIKDAFTAYEQRLQTVARNSAQAKVAQLELQSVLHGGRLIADRYAESVAKLGDVYRALPRQQQVRLATTAQPALAQIGDLVGALRDVPTQRVVRILASAGSARSQIEALRAAVAGIPPERVVRILSTANSERVKIAALRATIAGMPDRAVTRILANGAVSERVKVLAFTAAARGVPPRAVSKILADGALSEKAKVDALRGSIDSLRDKSVTITTRQLTIHEQRFYNNIMRAPFDRIASGRRAGAGADAIVGEGSRWQGAREAIVDRRTGAAWMVDRPTAVHLSDDHYVIPLDEHRSVAVGLLAGLARELGVDTFAGGRRAPRASAAGNRRRSSGRGGGRRRGGGDGNGHGPRWVPPKIAEGGVPFEDVKQRYEQAADALRRARDAEGATKKALREAQADLKEARSKEQRDSAQHEIDRLRKQLATNRRTIAERKPIAARRRRYLDRARETDNKIKNLQTEINVARDAMSDADRVDDQAAFDRAKRTRTGKLRSLIALLQRAFELAGRDNRNTDYFRSLKEQLSQLGGTAAVEGRREGFGGELGQVEAEEMDVEQPDEPEPEPMTDEEKKRLSRINADIALAALTPTLDDDKTRAQELVDFLTGVLAEVQADPAGRGGDDAIADIAGQLKTARDNLTALTTGNGTNDNADLQAQLDQERQRRETAETNARISDAAVAALTSSGDIGAGGTNAMNAATQPQIVIQTLHPGDPATLHAIGSAATAGIAYQGMRRSPRQRIGV